ncbi:MAG: NahK/ErcS family hybrid sensor histidine kinase/response regulator, partial [Nitratireductor sp.]
CVALAIMISNHIVIPLILNIRRSLDDADRSDSVNMEQQILKIRRWAITIVLLLAFAYYKLADNTQALASIGLISFAAIAQLAPAFFGGLFWRPANAKGAITGMVIGFAFWAYALFIPTFTAEAGVFYSYPQIETFFADFGFNQFSAGVLLSLFFNTAGLIVASLYFKSTPIEEHQATLFVGYKKNTPIAANQISAVNVSVEQVQNLLIRYLGRTRTLRAFTSFGEQRGDIIRGSDTASTELIQFSEQLLASAIGASSSRLVHSLLLKRFEVTSTANLKLLDEATDALQYNRDVLQTAFDQLEQGITIFDADYKLAFWNTQFRALLELPASIGQAGTPLHVIANTIAQQHRSSEDDHAFNNLQEELLKLNKVWGLALPKKEQILEIRTSPMPGGGIVIAWNNVTERMFVSEALREANETLEKRVEERTSDLVRANTDLEKATKSADVANESKTKFLAAASHDLLQPLNAARLYSATLSERASDSVQNELAGNISKSLDSVEELLGSILAISRLDSADPKMNITKFPINKILDQINIEFRPMAEEKNLELVILPSSLWVESDPAYLRRLIQNLVSNAIKYTPAGKVLVGCKRRKNTVNIEVMDTGLGIDASDQDTVFSEFTRLQSGVQAAQGLGLGLSIVDRISTILKHPVSISSSLENGTRFRVQVPRTTSQKKAASDEKKEISKRTNALEGMRILVVDNDPAILDGMRVLLEHWGCKVALVTGKKEAFKELRQTRFAPEIALVDYHLDDENGLETIKEIHENGFANLPAVLVTADRTPSVQQQASKDGVLIMNKPIKPAALRAILSQIKIQMIAAE